MKIDAKLSDAALLPLIGARLAGVRVAANLTQEQLAEQAGVGLRTIQRLELGAAATQLSGFLRVCRVLGLIERFESLLPETVPSPMEQLQTRGRARRRVRTRKAAPGSAQSWKWGDAR
jgi:transcriptional regulator with XRE-family HTH domain